MKRPPDGVPQEMEFTRTFIVQHGFQEGEKIVFVDGAPGRRDVVYQIESLEWRPTDDDGHRHVVTLREVGR